MATLYDFWRSSAAYRVRIALALKGVDTDRISIDITPGTDGQFSPQYRAVNPQMRVPALEVDGRVLGQSMAILEFLDERYPDPPLLPGDALQRARIRGFADTIACDIHPLNNVSVLGELRSRFGADGDAIRSWYASWIAKGFTALETLAGQASRDTFLFGPAPTLADVCLVPQMYNARRYDVDLSAYPRLVEVDAAARDLPAFAGAAPERQPGAPG